MGPPLIYIADHQIHLVGQVDVSTDEILTRVNWLERRRCPIANSWSSRIGKKLDECQAGRAEQVCRNTIAWERIAYGYQGWRRSRIRHVMTRTGNMRQSVRQWSAEISGLFCDCWYFSRKHRASPLTP